MHKNGATRLPSSKDNKTPTEDNDGDDPESVQTAWSMEEESKTSFIQIYGRLTTWWAAPERREGVQRWWAPNKTRVRRQDISPSRPRPKNKRPKELTTPSPLESRKHHDVVANTTDGDSLTSWEKMAGNVSMSPFDATKIDGNIIRFVQLRTAVGRLAAISACDPPVILFHCFHPNKIHSVKIFSKIHRPPPAKH